MTTEEMNRFLEISLALSSQRDREALLSSILDTAMDLTHCDAGTLYLLEEDGLHFCRMQTRSFHVRQGGHDDPITLPPVPLNPSHVCARAVLENALINVADVQGDTDFDFSGAKRYDRMTGYSTRSMLVVPLANDRGELIGVLQLINAMEPDGTVIPFPAEEEALVAAMGSQAAISLTNMLYAEQIRTLLDSLVGALSTAIDARTPYNANHTRNMVQYGTRFLDWLEETGNPWHFDPERRRTFLFSVWLHDVGKLVVPLSVMNKETRLGDRLTDVENRFREMELLNRIARLEGRITQEAAEKKDRSRREALDLIHRVNTAGFLPDKDLEAVQDIGIRLYERDDGTPCPWLTPEELTALSVRKGTLTAQEREIMESHVVMTAKILDQVTFPKVYAQVPAWAGAHHELLNGKGYPRHLTAEDIPPEVRLLTVLDVFDALTARDRPYKPGMPVEKALSILSSMVEEGAIDGDILALFRESRAWEGLL